MFQDFRKSLIKFKEDRVDEIGSKLVIKNKNYKELAENSTRVHYQIRDNLPDHVKELIGQYETINTSMQCISEEIMYEQGFIDGMRSKRMLKSLI
jgi:hypothetical protein